MESRALTTSDGVHIVGDFYTGSRAEAPAVLLLHMMPATKESWSVFAPKLVERGFQVLAIDERGHGKSTQKGKETLNFQKFSDVQQQEKMLDVVAAKSFFAERGVQPQHFFVGGASIGANLAIQYMARNTEARAGFALSPGYNYTGIETLSLMRQLSVKQAVYLAAAKDDTGVPDSYQAVQKLAQIGPAHIEHKIFEHGGHGTDIFAAHPDFMDELADWLWHYAT